MANPQRFLIAGNDEHGLNPPTEGKRTPILPYINRSFYENEFNRPAKYYFLINCLVCGFSVTDVKPEIGDLPISERVARINSRRPTLALTYAYNSAGETFSAANGYQVFYSRENSYAAASRLLAYDVTAGLGQKITLRNRGVSTLAAIGVLRSVFCPSALAECGFMTNFEEAKLMVDPDFQNDCGQGGCLGVCENLDVDYTETVGYSDLPTVREGNRGNAVALLQCYLNLYGSELTVDGIFGGNTRREVENFQRFNRLGVDGIVGSNTWRTLLRQDPLPLLKRGAQGVYVLYLQQKLLSKLYPVGAIDGIFGDETERAVRVFQQENGIANDGIVGPITWSLLVPIGGGRERP